MAFLNRPDSAGVVYRRGHTKPESVMVEIALPGWHWEVDMHDQRIDGDRALLVDRQPDSVFDKCAALPGVELCHAFLAAASSNQAQPPYVSS